MKAKLRIAYLLVTLALVAVVIAIVSQMLTRKGNNMRMRVAFPYDLPVTEYEPTKIHLAPEYIFLENTFSPLVELSPSKGDVVGGVAEEFYWENDELHLKIRSGLKTIDGTPITAEDAAFSLKRVVALTGNTHGNFADLVCPGEKVVDVEKPCPGIRVEENVLILKAVGKKTFLLPMLAAIDFAVIPRGSVDQKTLRMRDYRNTSGPYYVHSDDGKGNVVLKANPNHYHYSDKIAQEVVLVPSGIGRMPVVSVGFMKG